eukprot:1091424-Rhodomonas_salina.1
MLGHVAAHARSRHSRRQGTSQQSRRHNLCVRTAPGTLCRSTCEVTSQHVVGHVTAHARSRHREPRTHLHAHLPLSQPRYPLRNLHKRTVSGLRAGCTRVSLGVCTRCSQAYAAPCIRIYGKRCTRCIAHAAHGRTAQSGAAGNACTRGCTLPYAATLRRVGPSSNASMGVFGFGVPAHVCRERTMSYTSCAVTWYTAARSVSTTLLLRHSTKQRPSYSTLPRISNQTQLLPLSCYNCLLSLHAHPPPPMWYPCRLQTPMSVMAS